LDFFLKFNFIFVGCRSAGIPTVPPEAPPEAGARGPRLRPEGLVPEGNPAYKNPA
jgi:hypothetical protein